eukprot:jgi/Picre1/35585/NNA_003046.t1
MERMTTPLGSLKTLLEKLISVWKIPFNRLLQVSDVRNKDNNMDLLGGEDQKKKEEEDVDMPFSTADLESVPAIVVDDGQRGTPVHSKKSVIVQEEVVEEEARKAPGLFSFQEEQTVQQTRLISEDVFASSSQAAQTRSGNQQETEEIEDVSSYPFYSIKSFKEHMNDNPDLYGPFWIASTLIFISAAAGNTASYIAYHKKHHGAADGSGWYYDVDKVGGSMALFYGYIGIIGVLLYGILRYYKAGVSLATVWCTYGYALVSYIPMAALCVVPIEIARWVFVGVATAISGTFIVRNFQTVITEVAGMKASFLLLGMVGVHAALGLALKLYFFNY